MTRVLCGLLLLAAPTAARATCFDWCEVTEIDAACDEPADGSGPIEVPSDGVRVSMRCWYQCCAPGDDPGGPDGPDCGADNPIDPGEVGAPRLLDEDGQSLPLALDAEACPGTTVGQADRVPAGRYRVFVGAVGYREVVVHGADDQGCQATGGPASWLAVVGLLALGVRRRS